MLESCKPTLLRLPTRTCGVTQLCCTGVTPILQADAEALRFSGVGVCRVSLSLARGNFEESRGVLLLLMLSAPKGARGSFVANRRGVLVLLLLPPP